MASLLLLLLCCLSLFSASIDDVFGHPVGNERRLLQALKPCPVSFESQNYSVLTSQCKAPEYAPGPCCTGLKEIACPVADYINDLSTNCANNMFSYITTIGEYPSGLFASICRDGKDGLVCPAPPPSPLRNATPRAAPLFIPHLFPLLLLFSLYFIIM